MDAPTARGTAPQDALAVLLCDGGDVLGGGGGAGGNRVRCPFKPGRRVRTARARGPDESEARPHERHPSAPNSRARGATRRSAEHGLRAPGSAQSTRALPGASGTAQNVHGWACHVPRAVPQPSARGRVGVGGPAPRGPLRRREHGPRARAGGRPAGGRARGEAG